MTNFQAEVRALVIECLSRQNFTPPYAATHASGLSREGTHRRPLAQHEEPNNLLKTSNETTSLEYFFPSPSADLTTTEPRREFGVAKG